MSRAKYYFNENYFNVIDNENKAYWLGFLYADANINQQKTTLAITIHPKDISILESFKKCLEAEHPIRLTKRYRNIIGKGYKIYYEANFSIYNKYLITSLINHGIVPRKTYSDIFPTIIPEYLMSHYMRGFFDGDGSIYNKKGSTEKIKLKIAGNYKVCEWCMNIAKKFTNIPGGFVYQNNLSGNSFNWEIGGFKQITTFASWIYNNANLGLYRKYNYFINEGIRLPSLQEPLYSITEEEMFKRFEIYENNKKEIFV